MYLESFEVSTQRLSRHRIPAHFSHGAVHHLDVNILRERHRHCTQKKEREQRDGEEEEHQE